MNQIVAATCKLCNNMKLISDLIPIENYYICYQCAASAIPSNYNFLEISLVNKPKKIIVQ